MSQSAAAHRQAAPKRLRYCVLTISDTRTLETDSSGQLIAEHMAAAGHSQVERRIVPDEPHQIRAVVKEMVQLEELDVILATGGTGISPRDQTPEAIEPLFDVFIPGFGEMFRMLSYQEIGAATMLSRATAGRVGKTLVFALPGSSNAVRLAMEKLLVPELPHLVHHSRG
ncbi:MAG: molybdenum cofactor biosynthesis protein B [Pirellulaceae bacterium]